MQHAGQRGSGRAYYLAGTFFELYRTYGIAHYRQFIGHLLKHHANPPATLQNAPESVEITVRRVQPSGELLVHLVNYTGGMTRPVDHVVPLAGMSLKLGTPATRAKALVSGKDLKISRQGTVRLPPIREFEAILIEP